MMCCRLYSGILNVITVDKYSAHSSNDVMK